MTSTLVQTSPTPFGVYDLHFAPKGLFFDVQIDSSSFAVASSTGSVALYRLVVSQEGDATFPHPRICHVYTIQYFSKDILITSLHWPRYDLIAMTLSSGQVCLGRLRDPNVGSVLSVELLQHDFQAWHCSFILSGDGSGTPIGLVSGGDDATLRYIPVGADQIAALELGIAATSAESQTVPWVDKKIHQAGVTAVLPLGKGPTGIFILTGSYDDHIRLVHIPNVGRREVIAEEYLDGGVFRIKMARQSSSSNSDSTVASESYALIVSCMQAGARIVNLERLGGEWHFSVKAKFEENAGTLLYASDCQSSGTGGKRTILSTSFEDRKLYLWNADVSL